MKPEIPDPSKDTNKEPRKTNNTYANKFLFIGDIKIRAIIPIKATIDPSGKIAGPIENFTSDAAGPYRHKTSDIIEALKPYINAARGNKANWLKRT